MTCADKRQRMGVRIRKRIRMRRGFFAVGSPVDCRKGDPTGTVGTRLCPAKYSVLHRNNAVTQNRSFESPLRWQRSSAMKRADADTGARAVATASVVAVFFASPVSMNTTNRKSCLERIICRKMKRKRRTQLHLKNCTHFMSIPTRWRITTKWQNFVRVSARTGFCRPF